MIVSFAHFTGDFSRVRLDRRYRLAHRMAEALFFRFPFPGSRKLARVLAHLLLPRPHSPVAVPTVFDFSLLIHPRWHTDVYYLGFYERGTLEVMSACLRPGDTFVDVGAHVGLMSLFAARCVGNSGRVLAVEPVSELHGLLQQSVQMNGFTQVRTLHCALGASHARLPISLAGSCPSLVTSAAGGETETVEVLPLDELLTEKDWPVRMVKIDVEGYELEVITGAQRLLQRHDAPLLCLEYNDSMRGSASDPLAVFRLIESLNAYRFFQLEKTKSTPSRLKACRPESFRKEDNVFACTETMQHQLPQALFA